MSHGSNAYLFYGYCWKDGEGPWENWNYEGWEKRILQRRIERGESDLFWPFDENGSLINDEPETDAMGSEWYRAEFAIEEEFGGVSVGHHGIKDEISPFLYATILYASSYHGEVVQVQLDNLVEVLDGVAGINFDALFSEWIEATGADMSEALGPGWFVVSLVE